MLANAAFGDRCSLWVGLTIMLDSISQDSPRRIVDEIDRARAQEYALLATLLSRSPDSRLIAGLALLRGDTSPMGVAHTALGEAAGRVNEEIVRREYFNLFVGLGQGQLLPYSSHYLAGSLYGRPLARVREALQHLGIEKAPERSEPEDHAGILCEIMAGLVGGDIAAPAGTDRDCHRAADQAESNGRSDGPDKEIQGHRTHSSDRRSCPSRYCAQFLRARGGGFPRRGDSARGQEIGRPGR